MTLPKIKDAEILLFRHYMSDDLIIKTVFEHYGEVFIICRENKYFSWMVVHYKTGVSVLPHAWCKGREAEAVMYSFFQFVEQNIEKAGSDDWFDDLITKCKKIACDNGRVIE